MSAPSRYDPQMIRDFLRQLRLELQLSVLNLSAPASDSQSTMTLDLPAMGEMRQLQAKYDAVLVPKIKLVSEAGTRDDLEAVAAKINQKTLETRSQQLRRLESLAELLDEAVQCASMEFSQKWPEKKINVTSLVRKLQEERGETA